MQQRDKPLPHYVKARRLSLPGQIVAAGLLSTAPSFAVEPAPDATETALPAADKKPIVSSKDPVLLEASQVDYHQEESLAVASGSVEVSQGDTIVLADELTYDQKRNVVTAHGNVSMLEPSGNVYFADRLELKDDLKAGAIRQFKARLADDSLMVAARAKKLDENRLELFKAIYSPCKVTCSPDGKEARSPLWQVKADHVLVDQQKQKISYDNAFIETYGIPVFYTPYFSHPTPDADNQSGLLTPEFKHSSNLGNSFKIPVYYAISPDKDVTITPIITTNEGLVMAGEYRQALNNGAYSFDGSITRPQDRDALGVRTSGHQLRGHINGTGAFSINERYNWGFDIHRATDDTYLRRYNFSQETLLTSKLYIEGHHFPGMNDRSYGALRGISFQGMNAEDDQHKIPIVLPLGDFSFESDPGKYNSRFIFNSNVMALYRDTGVKSRRLSNTVGWKLPYISDDGQIIEFETTVRGDIYSVNDQRLSDGRMFDGTTGRLVPQASLTWRTPFINRGEMGSLMLEPIVNFTVSPGGGNPETIPNEDSLVPEFTDTNLFSPNRFAGYDRVENGPRVSYGMRGQAQFMEDKYLDWMFGQHYRIDSNRNFPFSNELDSHFSDYVGKVGMDYKPFNVAYRFRLDKDDLQPKRSEVDGGFNYYPVSGSVSYLSLKDDPILSTKEEITGTASVNLTKQWTWTVASRQDLLLNQITSAATGFTFKNECTSFVTVVSREYTRDRDIKPATTFLFRVSLANLD